MSIKLEECGICGSIDVWRQGQYDDYEDSCGTCGATRKGKIHWESWVKKPRGKDNPLLWRKKGVKKKED